MVVNIVFPDTLDTTILLEHATAILQSDRVASIEDLRRVLAGTDRQAYPSPVSIRASKESLRVIDLDEFSLYVDPADAAVSTQVTNTGTYEPHVSAVLRQLVRPGMVVLDVGANIGYHTMLLSGLVGPQGRVLAFEPNGDNARLILATTKMNGVRNVSLFPLALDSQAGWADFTAHVGSNGGLIRSEAVNYVERSAMVVPTVRLQDVVRGTVAAMKIDVEGAEGRVLRGAVDVLERDRPIVVSEFSCDMLTRVSAMDPLEYLHFFGSRAYTIQIIDREHPGQLGPPVSPEDLMASWGDPFRIEDLLLLPDEHRTAR